MKETLEQRYIREALEMSKRSTATKIEQISNFKSQPQEVKNVVSEVKEEVEIVDLEEILPKGVIEEIEDLSDIFAKEDLYFEEKENPKININKPPNFADYINSHNNSNKKN